MIVVVKPPREAPAALVADIRAVLLRHPGDAELRLYVGDRRLTYGDRVDVSRDLVAELEDLNLVVEIAA